MNEFGDTAVCSYNPRPFACMKDAFPKTIVRISRVRFLITLGVYAADSAHTVARTINVASDTAPGDLSEEFLELANGCLCCSIKDVGIASIEKLMQKKGAFDYILLETTGLADPGKQSLW